MTHLTSSKPIGCWHQGESSPEPLGAAVENALLNVGRPIYVVERQGRFAVSQTGSAELDRRSTGDDGALPLHAYAPPLHPEALGDPVFKRTHGLQYAYVTGEMANGITSVRMVMEAGRSGMVGFFGAGGLMPREVEDAVDQLQRAEPRIPFGVNLIHSPGNPELEMTLAEMFLGKQVRLVSASAFVEPTLPLAYYRFKGIRRDADGRIVCPNKLVGKVSRSEVARKFLSPPSARHIGRLVDLGLLSREEAALAASVPLVEDLTAEADSGGHTDNRPAMALFPTIQSVALRMQARYNYPVRLRVGLAGGIATPAAAAAAFAMGAAYIMTGSVNQACVESGTSDEVRRMLAETRQSDVTMAPAADMFEMGVTVQVLKRGTMFPMRASRLYEIYRSCAGIDEIPAAEKEKIEKTFFQASLADIWQQTRSYFLTRDPRQVERAERDPKHLMALVFRWYLGQAAHWAKDGDSGRRIDYQVWCGPAMGAFNEWVSDSFLAAPENRRVATVARNILFGAALITRINVFRFQGISLPADALHFKPLQDSQIKEYLS